eukprot:gene3318-6570_t
MKNDFQTLFELNKTDNSLRWQLMQMELAMGNTMENYRRELQVLESSVNVLSMEYENEKSKHEEAEKTLNSLLEDGMTLNQTIQHLETNITDSEMLLERKNENHIQQMERKEALDIKKQELIALTTESEGENMEIANITQKHVLILKQVENLKLELEETAFTADSIDFAIQTPEFQKELELAGQETENRVTAELHTLHQQNMDAVTFQLQKLREGVASRIPAIEASREAELDILRQQIVEKKAALAAKQLAQQEELERLERDRLARETEAKLRQQQAEDAARKKVDDEIRRIAEENARKIAEENARKKAEENARKKAEENVRKKAEEDAQLELEKNRKAAEVDKRKQIIKHKSLSMYNGSETTATAANKTSGMATESKKPLVRSATTTATATTTTSTYSRPLVSHDTGTTDKIKTITESPVITSMHNLTSMQKPNDRTKIPFNTSQLLTMKSYTRNTTSSYVSSTGSTSGDELVWNGERGGVGGGSVTGDDISVGGLDDAFFDEDEVPAGHSQTRTVPLEAGGGGGGFSQMLLEPVDRRSLSDDLYEDEDREYNHHNTPTPTPVVSVPVPVSIPSKRYGQGQGQGQRSGASSTMSGVSDRNNVNVNVDSQTFSKQVSTTSQKTNKPIATTYSHKTERIKEQSDSSQRVIKPTAMEPIRMNKPTAMESQRTDKSITTDVQRSNKPFPTDMYRAKKPPIATTAAAPSPTVNTSSSSSPARAMATATSTHFIPSQRSLVSKDQNQGIVPRKMGSIRSVSSSISKISQSSVKKDVSPGDWFFDDNDDQF